MNAAMARPVRSVRTINNEFNLVFARVFGYPVYGLRAKMRINFFKHLFAIL